MIWSIVLIACIQPEPAPETKLGGHTSVTPTPSVMPKPAPTTTEFSNTTGNDIVGCGDTSTLVYRSDHPGSDFVRDLEQVGGQVLLVTSNPSRLPRVEMTAYDDLSTEAKWQVTFTDPEAITGGDIFPSGAGFFVSLESNAGMTIVDGLGQESSFLVPTNASHLMRFDSDGQLIWRARAELVWGDSTTIALEDGGALHAVMHIADDDRAFFFDSSDIAHDWASDVQGTATQFWPHTLTRLNPDGTVRWWTNIDTNRLPQDAYLEDGKVIAVINTGPVGTSYVNDPVAFDVGALVYRSWDDTTGEQLEDLIYPPAEDMNGTNDRVHSIGQWANGERALLRSKDAPDGTTSGLDAALQQLDGTTMFYLTESVTDDAGVGDSFGGVFEPVSWHAPYLALADSGSYNFIDTRWGSICRADVVDSEDAPKHGATTFTDGFFWAALEVSGGFTFEGAQPLPFDEGSEVYLYRMPFVRGDANARFGPAKYGVEGLP